MLDFKSKTFKFIAIGVTLALIVFLLAFSGYYYKLKNNPEDEASTIVNTKPFFSGDILNFVLLIFITIGLILLIYFYLNKMRVEKFSSSIEEMIEYIYVFHLQNAGKFLDTTIGQNLQFTTLGNYVIFSFKKEGLTFEVDMITRVIKTCSCKSFDTSVKHAEQSDIIKAMVKGNISTGSNISELLKKGYDESDINNAMDKLQKKFSGDKEGSVIVQ